MPAFNGACEVPQADTLTELLSIVRSCSSQAGMDEERRFKFQRSRCRHRLGTTGFGLMLSRKSCRYSRIIAYCLILVSILALLNASVRTVSSQAFDTSTSTETNSYTVQSVPTANATQLNATQLPSISTEIAQITTTSTATQFTRYTIAYATSSLYVTIFKVQYTTANNLFTVVNVQFTTMTSSVTQVQLAQPAGAPSLPIHSSSGASSFAAEGSSGHIDGLMLQLMVASLILIILASIPLIRREKQIVFSTRAFECVHED